MLFCIPHYTSPPGLGAPTATNPFTLLSVTRSPVLQFESDPSLKGAYLFTLEGMKDSNAVRCGDSGVYAEVSLPPESSVSEGPEVNKNVTLCSIS